MTSASAHLPHENEGGTEKLLLPIANGYHDGSHYEKECNGFLLGDKETVKSASFKNSVVKDVNEDSDDNEKKHVTEETHNSIDLSIDDNLPIPFPLLAGEYVEQRIHCSEANIILTNFRLFACLPRSFQNIPVRTIEYVEMRELTVVHVNCKFGKVVRLCLDTPEDCAELWRLITSLEASQLKTEDLFAFQYFTNFNSLKCIGVSKILNDTYDCEAAMYVKDIKRMGFNTQTIWRTTEINSKFEVCKSYPKFHIVPAWVSDDELLEVAQFRSMRRFPSVVWRSKENGCVIARCSQPEVGWFGWRCEKDEHLLSAIAQAASLDSDVGTSLMSLSVTDMKQPTFLLVDARSYATAVANRAKGGGCECQEYYPTCDIQFMGLVNIHAIRKSFQSIRSLSVYGQEQANWYSSLEKTGWLHYLSALIRSSLIIVEAIDVERRSAIVHCTDGWDRTTQLVSLAELLLDPYYRTIKGFSVLVEREWLEFGHKFADRCGHSPDKNINEISPVFFQWVDAVHQIMRQFPSAFQFNESFLIKLVQHVYSCLFGTFLCNSVRERHQLKVKSKTLSIWNLLLSGKKDFINFLYVANEKKILYPSYHIRNLEFWENVFIGDTEYPDVQNRPDPKSADLSDSGNFTQNSSSSNGGLKYNNANVSNEISPPTLMAETVCNGSNTVVENTMSAGEADSLFSKPGFKSMDFNLIENSSQADSIDDEDLKNHTVNTTIPNGIPNGICNPQSSCENDSNSEVELNNFSDPSSCNNNDKSYEEDESSTISDNAIELTTTSMTDSVKTLTGEVDRHQSFDDSCLPGKVFPTQEIDPTHLLIDRSNPMRKVHSSPESPKVTRLPRTKSVPDVMTASLCIDTDISKTYPSLENNKQLNKDLIRDLSRYIDCDGLTVMHNYIDHKLINIEQQHSLEISKLQKRILMERQTRISLQKQLQQLSCKDGADLNPANLVDPSQDDLLSLPDSVNGERSSVSSLSNDEGWEQVQYDDVQPTRWVPDHVSSNCSHCGQQFSIILRRHHCRLDIRN